MSGSHKGQIVWRIDASLYFMEGQYSSSINALLQSRLRVWILLISLCIADVAKKAKDSPLSQPPQMHFIVFRIETVSDVAVFLQSAHFLIPVKFLREDISQRLHIFKTVFVFDQGIFHLDSFMLVGVII